METWLTIIVVLLIVGILLDGWRRMRSSRQNAIRLSRKSQRFDSFDEPLKEPFTSELPNGGARVAPRDLYGEATDNAKVQSPQAKTHIPQQVTLNLDESVPMLMESVEPSSATQSHSSQATEPSGFDADESDNRDPDERVEPSFSAIDESESDSLDELDNARSDSACGGVHNHEPEVTPEQPDEVIIINVMAPEQHLFAGDAMLDVLLQCGMRFGEMNIFHRHAHETGEGPVLFSLANMVKPGVFDLENMDSFQTPGVSLFMTLPMRPDSLTAFDLMRDVAQSLAEHLGGELKDENRSVMTRQTMEHCRQRIAEYERKRLSRANG